MASALLKQRLRSRTDVEVMSAGVAALWGMPVTMHTLTSMKGEGIDLSQHMSKPVSKELIEAADLILTMERKQQEFIEQLVPQAKGKVHLLLEYAGLADPENAELPDPIGQPLERYEQALGLLKQAVERIAAQLNESSQKS